MPTQAMTWLEDHWLDILGWGGSALLVYSLLQARVLRFRTLNLVACLVLVAFNALIAVWPMVAMNVVLCAINIWFIARLLRQRHDDAAFGVIEVRPDDHYLQHVLHTHRAEIARFQPGLHWSPTDLESHAFVVVKGDETVGAVLLRAEGAEREVARVQLDYVTPKYRDFSPGEFVWRQSTALREHGFRRVVSPAGMVAPYYDRLGFRRDGEQFVLEL